ncbi:MAG: hypothetical protein H7Z76_03465 [Methylotenera sp.]|nr:hypothetical protein [Flavobacterium sp.]
MKTFFLLCAFVTFLFLSGCKKSYPVNDMTAIEKIKAIKNMARISPLSIYDYLTNQASGILYISNHGGYLNQQCTDPRIAAYFRKNTIDNVLPSTIDNIGLDSLGTLGYKMNSGQKPDLIALFGHTAKINLHYKAGSEFISKFKLPVTEILSLPEQNISNIYTGKTITWNSSNQNEDVQNKYVLISLSYDPTNNSNQVFAANGFNTKIYSNIILDDNGAYEFSNSDLEKFPPKGVLNLEIYKGNFITPQDQNSEKNFFIGSYSMISFSTILENP